MTITRIASSDSHADWAFETADKSVRLHRPLDLGPVGQRRRQVRRELFCKALDVVVVVLIKIVGGTLMTVVLYACWTRSSVVVSSVLPS